MLNWETNEKFPEGGRICGRNYYFQIFYWPNYWRQLEARTIGDYFMHFYLPYALCVALPMPSKCQLSYHGKCVVLEYSIKSII